jgi:hypothetical protein
MNGKQRESGPGVTKAAPTIERGRRCENCLHWSCGEDARAKYEDYRRRDFLDAAARTVAAEGNRKITKEIAARVGPVGAPKAIRRLGDHDSGAKLGLNMAYGDALILGNMLGICHIEAAPGDFVHAHYLCGRWTQKYRPDGAEKPDELPEEARERLGLENRKP